MDGKDLESLKKTHLSTTVAQSLSAFRSRENRFPLVSLRKEKEKKGEKNHQMFSQSNTIPPSAATVFVWTSLSPVRDRAGEQGQVNAPVMKQRDCVDDPHHTMNTREEKGCELSLSLLPQRSVNVVLQHLFPSTCFSRLYSSRWLQLSSHFIEHWITDSGTSYKHNSDVTVSRQLHCYI